MSIPRYDPILDRYADEIAESEQELLDLTDTEQWPVFSAPKHQAPAHSPAAFTPVWRRRQQLAKDLTGQVTR